MHTRMHTHTHTRTRAHTHTHTQEHTYHVLESDKRPQHGEAFFQGYSCPDGRADSQPSDPCTPIYHTIHDERPAEEQLYAQVPSSPSQTANNQPQENLMGPIYQDVDDLSLTFLYADNGIVATQMLDGSPKKDSLCSSTTVRTVVEEY